jgi:hypothetical protein
VEWGKRMGAPSRTVIPGRAKREPGMTRGKPRCPRLHLTSTYFESAPPDDDNDKRRFGYSRDKRSDCVQVVIALIVTPDGFPLAYEVLPGNTADSTTLREFCTRSKLSTARPSGSG